MTFWCRAGPGVIPGSAVADLRVPSGVFHAGCDDEDALDGRGLADHLDLRRVGAAELLGHRPLLLLVRDAGRRDPGGLIRRLRSARREGGHQDRVCRDHRPAGNHASPLSGWEQHVQIHGVPADGAVELAHRGIPSRVNIDLHLVPHLGDRCVWHPAGPDP